MRPHRIEPGPGQESVWDYPRPPRLEPVNKRLRIIFNHQQIADTNRAQRVLETSHPPVYYLPPADIRMEYLIRTEHGSYCEWKGQAVYYTVLVDGKQATNAAWAYLNPTRTFQPIQNYLAFYAGLMDSCYVDDELVVPQPGNFYGGWITRDIVGPFKGEPGSWGW